MRTDSRSFKLISKTATRRALVGRNRAHQWPEAGRLTACEVNRYVEQSCLPLPALGGERPAALNLALLHTFIAEFQPVSGDRPGSAH